MNLVHKLIALDNVTPKRIVIIGDALIDRWILGKVEPCQDNCQKFVETEYLVTAGGAANAKACLMHWQANVKLCAVHQTSRGVKTRYVAHDGMIVFRHDDENRNEIDYEPYRTDALVQALAADAILLSDYDKGFLTQKFIQQVVAITKDRSIWCVADAKRAPALYGRCVIKGNLDYNTKFLNYDSFSIGNVITRGSTPPISGCQDSPSICKELPPVECVNHVGAGDCFAAHLTLALAHGFSLMDAATIAYSAGRVYVQHPYNEPPTPEAIAEDLDAHK